MKAALIAASAVLALSGVTAYAQDAGPTYNSSIHQSAGDRDSRGTPKYYQHSRQSRVYRQRMYRQDQEQPMTTGAGSSYDSNGPFYDNSIHQSAGDRDSRGTPKYNNDH